MNFLNGLVNIIKILNYRQITFKLSLKIAQSGTFIFVHLSSFHDKDGTAVGGKQPNSIQNVLNIFGLPFLFQGFMQHFDVINSPCFATKYLNW